MAADKSRTENQALIIHDPRISMDTFDATNSTVTQTGPSAGVPEPSVVTQMALQATGEQTEAITVFTAQAGGDDAAWGWRDSDGVDYYWDGPTAVRQARAIGLTIGGTPTVLSNSSVLYKGKIVTLTGIATTTGSLYAEGRFKVSALNGVADESQSISFAEGDFLPSQWDGVGAMSLSTGEPDFLAKNPVGALCVMPNGRLHAYCISETQLGSAVYIAVDLYISDDGETFYLNKVNVLNTDFISNRTFGSGEEGGIPTNISVAATNNGVVLLIDLVKTDTDLAWQNTLLQFYSVDGGFSFDLLGVINGSGDEDLDMGSLHKVVATPDGGFLVAYAALTAIADEWLHVKKLRSCLVPLNDIDAILVADNNDFGSKELSGYYEGADLDIKVTQDGLIYIVYASRDDEDITTWQRLNIAVSEDNGDTWLENFYSFYQPYANTDLYLEKITSVPVGASIYVQANMAGTHVDLSFGDASLVSLECGGWTSISRPYVANTVFIPQQYPYRYNYLPFILPVNNPHWTPSALGTVTHSLAADADSSPYLKTVVASLSSFGAVIEDPTGTDAVQSLALIDVKVETDRADFEFYLSSFLESKAQAYRVRVTTTQLIVSSLNITGTSATTLFTESLPNPGGRHQIYVAIDTDALVPTKTIIYVGIRAHDATMDRAFAWTEYSSTGETKLSYTTPKSQLEYNLPTSSTAYLYGIQLYIGKNTNEITINNTKTLVKSGRLFSDKNVYAGKNVSISAYGGPTYIGDEWTIDPVYDYGLANLFEEGSPSPNVPWRATDDSEQNIIFRLSDYGDDASMMSKAMGVFFFNANFESAEIYGSNTSGAGAWTLLKTIEANSGFEELSWVRKGDVIRPPAEDLSPSAPYIPMNALIGSTFHDNVEDASGKIIKNTEGTWIEGGLLPTPSLRIGTVSDPISAEEAGEGYIWVKDFGAIINNLADYEYIRIRIPACTTADGYISLGALVVGNVHYLGRRHGRQRTASRKANVQTTTLRSGAKRTRVLGPTRREETFGWANENEIDETQLYTSVVDPDYIAIGGIPQNTVAGTAKLIEGIIEELQGEHGLVTYVKAVPSNGTIKPFSFLRGRIVSSYNEDVVLGNEMNNELKRISSVTISEEV